MNLELQDVLILTDPAGMGNRGVSRGILMKTGEEVAVKLSRFEPDKTRTIVDAHMKMVSHRNIAPYYGITHLERSDRVLLVLVMQLAHEGSLGDHPSLKAGGHGDAFLILCIALQIAEAINYLQGLQPLMYVKVDKSNVLVFDKGNNVKLCDFGPLSGDEHDQAALDARRIQEVYQFGVLLRDCLNTVTTTESPLLNSLREVANTCIVEADVSILKTQKALQSILETRMKVSPSSTIPLPRDNLLVYRGPGVDVSPVVNSLTHQNDFIFEPHIFDCCDPMYTPMEALRKHAPDIDLVSARIVVLLMLSESNLKDEQVKQYVTQIIFDLGLCLTQYAIVVWARENSCEQLEDELWRHRVRGVDKTQELAVVFYNGDSNSSEVIIDVLHSIKGEILHHSDEKVFAHERAVSSAGSSLSFCSDQRPYTRSLSSGMTDVRRPPMRQSHYAADTVIVRQKWKATKCTDSVVPLENFIQQKYIRAPGKCLFCEVDVKDLVQHMSRHCAKLNGRDPKKARRIDCAIGNIIRTLTMSKLLKDSEILLFDEPTQDERASLIPKRNSGMPFLVFERLASLSLGSKKCPLCNFAEGFFSSSLDRHIEKDHFETVRIAIKTSHSVCKDRLVIEMIKAEKTDLAPCNLTGGLPAFCPFCGTNREFATEGALADHICGVHGTQLALRSDKQSLKDTAITLVACGVLCYDEHDVSVGAALSILSKLHETPLS